MKPGRVLQGICAYVLLTISGSLAGALPQTWHVRPASNSNDLNGVTYGNRVFVAVGDHGTILISSNGTEWLARSAGIANSTFLCAAWTFSGFHIGGEGVLTFWRDGADAFNRFSANGAEQMYAIVSEYQFLGVGRDRLAGKSFVVHQGKTNSVPTTNALYAISWRKARHGEIIVSAPLIAVGDRGTIIRSTNGIDWTVQDSGTSVPLRAAVFHEDKIIVGGDGGVLLTSADGISWTALPHLSFDIRALASSGIAVVAVGEDGGTGRVQVSPDGAIWPGEPFEFAQPLNAVTHGRTSFMAVGDGGLIVESGYAPDLSVNSWMKPTSGLWEEQFWSCGRLPASDQGMVAVTNAGSKSVEIGRSTTANFSNALSLWGLRIEAPVDSFNELRLNNAGTNVPLDVQYLTLTTNASLVSYASALKAYDFWVHSSAMFADASKLSAGGLWVWGSLTLSNSSTFIGTLRLASNAVVHQFGGRSDLYRAALSGGSSLTLHSGTFSIDEISLEYPVYYLEYTGKAIARILQNGGDLLAEVIKIGDPRNSNYRGEIVLEGGTLRCPSLEFFNGTFTQNGGTNMSESVGLPSHGLAPQASYSLAGGTLLSGNVGLGMAYFGGGRYEGSSGRFFQSGGVHRTSGIFLNGYVYWVRPGDQLSKHLGFYSLSGGHLEAGGISVCGTFTQSGGTNHTRRLSVSDGGSYRLIDGELRTGHTHVSGHARAYSYSCSGMGGFTQESGAHVVETNLIVGSYSGYWLKAGTLAARNIRIGPHAGLSCSEGVISNWGTITLQGGTFEPGSRTQDLGQLELLEVTNWPCRPTTNHLGLSAAGGVLRFRDSRDVAWSGLGLRIFGWNGDGSSQRLFFGTSAQGLTAAQLIRLVFVNPVGWRPGEYPARILKSGEVVPVVPPMLSIARDSHEPVLSWPGEYDLFRATNIAGPFQKVDDATSPDLFSAPQQFFQLRLREE